jgi:drug/metabolite transporter (DMT)-like permease
MLFKDIFQLIILAAFWGGSFLFLRIAAPVLGPVWLIEIRVLFAGLILLLFAARLGLITTIRQNWIQLLIIGSINSAIPFLLFAFASLSLPAGFTSILNATTPLFGTIVAAIWLKEKLTASRIIGFALGFAGVVILVGWKTFAVTQSFVNAVVAAIIAAFLYAVSASYTRKYLDGVPPIAIATGSLLSAAILIAPLMPFFVPTNIPTATVMLAVLGLSLFSTALSYILYFRLIRNIGSTKTLTVTYLSPGFAMLWSQLILKEPITQSMIIGCSFILLGTATANDLLTKLFNQNQNT